MSWFTKTQDEFTTVARLKQGCNLYVEVGVWTGDSSAWVMENIQPKQAYGIDPFWADLKRSSAEIDKIYEATVQRMAAFPNYKLVREDSQKWLRLFRSHRQKIDLLYLDGRHDAAGVVLDFCLAWEHLAKNAVVIFDDYGIGRRKAHRHVPEAVEALLLAFGDQIDYIHRGPLQAAFRVRTKEPPVEPDLKRFVRRAARHSRTTRRDLRHQRRANRAARLASREGATP